MPFKGNGDVSSSPLCSVSEEEVTKEANELGVTRETYVQDLLQALTRSEEGRGGRIRADEQAYSFLLTPDHCCLSYQKICNGILVSKSFWVDFIIALSCVLKILMVTTIQ